MTLKVLWVGKAGPELAHNRPNPANQRPDLFYDPIGGLLWLKQEPHTQVVARAEMQVIILADESELLTSPSAPPARVRDSRNTCTANQRHERI